MKGNCSKCGKAIEYGETSYIIDIDVIENSIMEDGTLEWTVIIESIMCEKCYMDEQHEKR